MSVLGDNTNGTVFRRQRDRALLLLAVLDVGQRQDLPPIDWTVSARGPLVGRYLGFPASDRRRVWQAWTDALSADVTPEWHSVSGAVYLKSVVPDPRLPSLPRIVLMTTCEPDDAEDTSALVPSAATTDTPREGGQ